MDNTHHHCRTNNINKQNLRGEKNYRIIPGFVETIETGSKEDKG
jgi:hypothetical protein